MNGNDCVIGRAANDLLPRFVWPSLVPANTPPIPAGPFTTITVDPPWQYDDPGCSGAAAKKYALLNKIGLNALNVKAVAARNAHLYVWTTNSFIPEAHELARGWGFTPKGFITWHKTNRLGLGRYFRNETEHVVFAVRGNLGLKSKSLRNFIESEPAGHSVKPQAFYDLVEQASPGPYLEMFARGPRAGWTTWGLEADGGILGSTPGINPILAPVTP